MFIYLKETPVSSTQSSVTLSSSSIAASTANSGSILTSSSSLSPPFSSVSSFSVSQQNSQLYNSQPHSSPKDEIYIDDEGLEGSGGRGEVSFKINFIVQCVNV